MTGLLIEANVGAFVVASVAGAAGTIALGRAKSGAVVDAGVDHYHPGRLQRRGGPGHGVLTLVGTRMWARRIEAGQAIFRPKPGP